jgi:hypothetical protein
VIDATWTDPWVGGVGSFVSETGSWAAFVAAVLTAAALRLGAKVSWPPLLILAAFGWELQDSHAMPHGPVAFALLVVAAVWIWVAFRAPTASGRPIAAPARSPAARGTRPGP